ncbi:MAG: PAS domain S-box protein [Candidatus Omnitrophica bacterium]|nr:PAS domain S-box protein [Candidatus Omnitrophota bacterium]
MRLTVSLDMKTKTAIMFFAAGLLVAVLAAFGEAPLPLLAAKVALLPFISAALGVAVSKIVCRDVEALRKDLETSRSEGNRYRPVLASCPEMARLSVTIDDVMRELKEKTAQLVLLDNAIKLQGISLNELRGKEEHYRKLFEQSNEAVFIYDIVGKLMEVNRKACEMLGYSREDLMRMSIFDLYPPEELSSVKEARVVRAGEKALRYESVFKKSDDSRIIVEISSSMVDLKKGVTEAVVNNITARKELEKALKESEERFRTFMETASDLMFIADRDGKVSYINEAMHNALGYERNELIGKRLDVLMDQKTRAEYSESRFELSKKGKITYESVWEAKNQRKILGEMKETAIYDQAGIFSGSRGVFRDISERKKIERAQRLAQLGELAADVAHEVNNPVMIIAGRTELLLMNETDEKRTSALKIILDQCGRARDIVQRLLKFSKPSKGLFKETDINAAIEATVELIGPQFMSSGVSVQKKYGSGLPQIKMDEKLMQEVFLNLLRNAHEAMPHGGSITISTYTDGDFLRADFQDTGSGIGEEDMRRIFDPFFTTKETGTGLGLSVCYGIMKLHGGELRYSSEQGKGTRASVLLPLDADLQDHKVQ